MVCIPDSVFPISRFTRSYEGIEGVSRYLCLTSPSDMVPGTKNFFFSISGRFERGAWQPSNPTGFHLMKPPAFSAITGTRSGYLPQTSCVKHYTEWSQRVSVETRSILLTITEIYQIINMRTVMQLFYIFVHSYPAVTHIYPYSSTGPPFLARHSESSETRRSASQMAQSPSATSPSPGIPRDIPRDPQECQVNCTNKPHHITTIHGKTWKKHDERPRPGKMNLSNFQIKPSTLVLGWSGCLGCMLFGQGHLAKAYQFVPLVNLISVCHWHPPPN